ncbi:hypothetical protein D3C71_2170070 [compost metagenome]
MTGPLGSRIGAVVNVGLEDMGGGGHACAVGPFDGIHPVSDDISPGNFLYGIEGLTVLGNRPS